MLILNSCLKTVEDLAFQAKISTYFNNIKKYKNKNSNNNNYKQIQHNKSLSKLLFHRLKSWSRNKIKVFNNHYFNNKKI